jgi:transcription termination factor Rho
LLAAGISASAAIAYSELLLPATATAEKKRPKEGADGDGCEDEDGDEDGCEDEDGDEDGCEDGDPRNQKKTATTKQPATGKGAQNKGAQNKGAQNKGAQNKGRAEGDGEEQPASDTTTKNQDAEGSGQPTDVIGGAVRSLTKRLP